MRCASRMVWSVLIALGVILPAAHAEEHVGKDHRLVVPHGFEALAEEDVAASPAHAIDLIGRVAPPAALERRVYLAGSMVAPDALLVVARIQVDPDQFAASRVRHRYILDRLHLDADHFEALVADGHVVIRPAEVGGHDALEMKHPGAEGPLGLEEPAAAALLVDGGTYVLVVCLMVRDTTVYPLEETWARIRGSLVVEPPVALARTALLYGGIGLVALILLVVLVRVIAARRPRTPSRYEGAGLSMASDGWGGKPAAVAGGALPAEPATPSTNYASHLDQPVPSPRPLLEPDLEEPDLEEPELAEPAPLAEPPTPLRAAEAPAAVPPPVPPPMPAPKPAAVPPPVPAPTEDAPPAGRPAPAKRKGLKRTLPASGRYGH